MVSDAGVHRVNVSRRSAIKRIASLVIAGPAALDALDEVARGRSMVGWTADLATVDYELSPYLTDRDAWFLIEGPMRKIWRTYADDLMSAPEYPPLFSGDS